MNPVLCSLDGLQGSKMYVVWLLPLGGALAFNKFDESATRETQPAKTQLCQCQSRHAMTQRLRWRTDRCATVPSQCRRPPPGIHPPAAFHTSAPLCGFPRSEARLQDCPAALRCLHGLLVNGWCQKHALLLPRPLSSSVGGRVSQSRHILQDKRK